MGSDIPSTSKLRQSRPLRKQHFPTYLDTPKVSLRARLLCEAIFRGLSSDAENVLSSTGVIPNPELVEEVLKLSYGFPADAVLFFRWAGLAHKPSAYAWNLMVDLLGKNEMFEEMWDAIRSMKQETVLSTATFVSAFGSYCLAGRLDEAIMTFDVMDKYGVEPDVHAVNSLLSGILQEENQTTKAWKLFERIRSKIPPNADTFAILLEGCEKEGNVARAKTTFGDMVLSVGFHPQNKSAYDAFLTTLVRASQFGEAIKFLEVMVGKNCMPGLNFFSNSLDILVKNNDSIHALPLWDSMVSSGLMPNLIMYNAMIGLLCGNNDIDNAFRLFDGMVFHGAFPDSLTFNMIFQCLVKNKKVREVGSFFTEMTKNECPPTHLNCAVAISMLFDLDDPEMAVEIWDYMLENGIAPVDESANALLRGLLKMSRFGDFKRFAYDMLDRRIRISESTMEKLKSASYKESRSVRDIYDSIQRKRKAF